MTLKYRSLMTITAVGIGLTLGWGLGMQPIHAQDAKDAKAKVWQGKDNGKEEFGLAQAMDKATDPKAKIEALDKWKAAFPQSDYDDIRQEQYLFAYQGAMMNRQAFDKALEILKTKPNHFQRPIRHPIPGAEFDAADGRGSRHSRADRNVHPG